MRTINHPNSGMTWRLCPWNDACQMPVSTVLDGKESYCRWHARSCSYPAQAHAVEFFEQWLGDMQLRYPSDGWWGWEAKRLWPVLQGVETIWIAEAKAA